MNHLVFPLLGLGGGAVVALLGLGLVTTYRSTGVVNLAHAATGMWIAHVAFHYRDSGRLALPFLGLPHEVAFIPRPTPATTALVVAGYAAILAVLLYATIFRWVARGPELGRMVASIGLFLYLWAVASERFPNPPPTPRFLPSGSVIVADTALFVDRFVAATIAVAITAALIVVSRRTRFGIASTAISESFRGALLTGIPVERTTAANWVLATLLSGSAMVVSASFDGLSPLNMSMLIVPALTAALIARFRSFGVVTAAGFALGMGQAALLDLQTEWTALHGLGLQRGLPFVVILATLALGRGDVAARGTIESPAMPEAPRPRRVASSAAVLTGGAVLMTAIAGSDWRLALVNSMIATIISLSVVVLSGYAGQVSLAPFALAGLGAFGVAKLGDLGVPFPLAPLVAVVVATAFGALLAIPSTRVRGMNLAIATLGAAVAVEELAFKWAWFAPTGARVDEPSLGGFNLGIDALGDAYPRREFVAFVLLATLLCSLLVVWLRTSSVGLAWLAVRSNERAATALGLDVAQVKATAFGVSAFLAAVAGCLLAYQRREINSDGFGVFLSLAAVATTYLAGITTVSGALLAGVIAPLGLLTAFQSGGDLAADVSPHQFAVNGALLVLVAVVAPSGVTGVLRTATSRRARRDGEAHRALRAVRPSRRERRSDPTSATR